MVPARVRAAGLAMIVTVAPFCAAGASTDIIELKHRPASEVIPLIKPFLAPEDAVSGTGFQLIVRTSPATLTEIRRILASIDRAPRRLLISVRQVDTRAIDQRSVGASGTVEAGDDNARITAGAGRDDARRDRGAEVRITRTRGEAEHAGVQQIQVLEGHSASIRVGRSVPIVTRAGSLEGRTRGKEAEFAYRDVTAGFDVIPRVNGDQVTLDIRPHRAALQSDAPGTIAIQHMHSTVSGRLGEWLLIGGITATETAAGSGYVFTTRRTEDGHAATMVKVDERPE